MAKSTIFLVLLLCFILISSNGLYLILNPFVISISLIFHNNINYKITKYEMHTKYRQRATPIKLN